MRVIAAPKGASLDTSLPSHSSLPLMNPTGTGTRLALLATLLAYHGNQPVGGLQLVSSGPLQAHATRLAPARVVCTFHALPQPSTTFHNLPQQRT